MNISDLRTVETYFETITTRQAKSIGIAIGILRALNIGNDCIEDIENMFANYINLNWQTRELNSEINKLKDEDNNK